MSHRSTLVKAVIAEYYAPERIRREIAAPEVWDGSATADVVLGRRWGQTLRFRAAIPALVPWPGAASRGRAVQLRRGAAMPYSRLRLCARTRLAALLAVAGVVLCAWWRRIRPWPRRPRLEPVRPSKAHRRLPATRASCVCRSRSQAGTIPWASAPLQSQIRRGSTPPPAGRGACPSRSGIRLALTPRGRRRSTCRLLSRAFWSSSSRCRRACSTSTRTRELARARDVTYAA